MRCIACDDPLSQVEQSRKSPNTGEDYLLCTRCLAVAGLLFVAEEKPWVEPPEDDTDPDFYDILGDQNGS